MTLDNTKENQFDEQEDFLNDDEGDDIAPASVEAESLPLFPFDEPQTVTLPNGTIHGFIIPSLDEEQRKETLMKTIIKTSAAKINGQSPRSITTDYSKAHLAYYLDCVKTVSGYAFNEGDNPDDVLDARKVVGSVPTRRGGERKQLLCELIPTGDQKAAAERLYGGKIEVVKPERKDGERVVVVLTARRRIHVRQEIGVEQLDDGSFSKPTAVIDYFFNEPKGKHLSKWETQAFNGEQLAHQDGGSVEERTYSVKTCADLFDSLIDETTGGSVKQGDERVPCDVRVPEHLKAIPSGIKKNVVAILMNDVTTNAGK